MEKFYPLINYIKLKSITLASLKLIIYIIIKRKRKVMGNFRNLILMLSLTFIIGCGGGSGSNNTEENISYEKNEIYNFNKIFINNYDIEFEIQLNNSYTSNTNSSIKIDKSVDSFNNIKVTKLIKTLPAYNIELNYTYDKSGVLLILELGDKKCIAKTKNDYTKLSPELKIGDKGIEPDLFCNNDEIITSKWEITKDNKGKAIYKIIRIGKKQDKIVEKIEEEAQINGNKLQKYNLYLTVDGILTSLKSTKIVEKK